MIRSVPCSWNGTEVPVRDLSLPSRLSLQLSHYCLIRAHASPKCKSNLLSQQGPHLGCRNLHTPPPFSWLPRGRELFLLPSAGELARGCTQPGSHFRPAQPAGTQEHFLALTQRLSSCHKIFPPPQSTQFPSTGTTSVCKQNHALPRAAQVSWAEQWVGEAQPPHSGFVTLGLEPHYVRHHYPFWQPASA